MKISVFTVMLPDLTPEQAAQELKVAGYDGVEWRVTHIPEERKSETPFFWGNNLCTLDVTPEDAERGKRLAQEAGLEIPGLGTYIEVGDLEATERAMHFAQICGAPQIRVNAGRWPDGDLTYQESFARGREFVEDCIVLGQKYNVRTLVEIHHKTNVPSASLAHRLLDGLDPDWVGVIHDAGNMVHEGFENYLMGLQLLGPYLKHVHIKNARYNPPQEGTGVWQASWSPLEDGVVDWAALFAALQAVGYDGWLGIEDFSSARPSKEALAHNIAFLRAAIAASQ